MARRTTVRPAAVAGQFYAGTGQALREEVDALLAEAPQPGPDAQAPKAVIAPHAGFMFSGSVAATAYRRLEPARGQIRRVVVLGPSHFVPIRGLAAPRTEWFDTPLGAVPVDAEGLAIALAQTGVTTNDSAHEREHSLETQLPFIQRVLGDVTVVPLVVGDADAETVARVLGALWGGDETAIAISSDLSHFHDDPTARRLDQATAAAIEALKAESLGPRNACGFLPIAGLLVHAARRRASVHTLELRNSGDAGAPRSSVVGYGAFELCEAEAA